MHERERLQALEDLQILDTPAEEAFDGLVQAAALVCRVPISLISLVDHARQWFKANVGLEGVSETPRDIAFCTHAIASDELFEVPDATTDARFAANPLVTADPAIRFYAGVPLRLSDGANVGTLCVIDRSPKSLSDEQRQVLRHLAIAAVKAMEARRTSRRLAESEAKFRALSEAASDAIVSVDAAGHIAFFNPAAERMFRCQAERAVGTPLTDFVPSVFAAGAVDDELTRHPLVRSPYAAAPVRRTGRRADGEEFPSEIALSATAVEGSAICVAVIRDITERSELEARAAQRSFDLLHANAQLRLTADQLRTAQRISHVGSWEFDPRSGEVRWSDELFRVAGRSPRDGVVGFAAQEQMYTPESWARLYKAVGSCLDAGTPYELELELVRPGGERRSTVARGEARRDAEGKVDFLFGTLQDVSDLKRARDLERQASERAQLATRAAGMGVWEWDIAGDRVTWDATMGQLWGGEGAASERSLDDWFDLVLPADREVMRQSFGNALAGERELQWILRRPDANDRIRHLRASGTLRLDAIGFPSRVLGVSWDVTAQHEAQAATRASEGLLKEFVRYVPAAIAMFDQDMRYLQASERWAHFFGQPIEGLIGASHYALFADTPQHWRDMHRRVLAGEALHSDEDPVADGEGNTRWYEWDAHPWHQPNGSVGGVIWYTKDITNKKLLELELVERRNALERSQADRERAVRELERSNVELQQFAYVASHDLQEPLRAVAGCAQLLKDSCAGRLDPKADELIAHIVDGAERMRALIRDLLALSRVGAQSLGLTEVDCDEACQIALANLEAARRTSDAVVRVDPLPSAPGEARQIVQLFQNLIGNALKYRSAERPAIHVGCNVADDEHIYFVADNGIGIEPQYFDRIFGVFQRLHTRTAYEGTGIGLAICSKVVQRHDGRIWVESQPGKGSTFRFALPRQPKEVAP